MKIRHLLPMFAVLAALAFHGCGSGTSSSSDDSIYYNAVQEVAPSFAPAAGAASVAGKTSKAYTASWETGNPLYELFYIFRQFDPATDSGVIDTSNIFKTTWEGRNFFSNTESNCIAITEQTIAPPFDFGNAATAYDCAFNEEPADGYDFGGAVRKSDTAVKYGLFGFLWPNADHNEYGVMQAVMNTTTSDLDLDIAVWVNYEGEGDYCYRNDITGNTETHAFALRSMKGNKVAGSSFLSVVAGGFSEGTGKYFLAKITTNDLNGKYYCIAAGDGEAELRAMDAAGSDTVDLNCAEYQAAVDALTPLTTADLACASSDFNPGGTGTAAEGTIFLNYQ